MVAPGNGRAAACCPPHPDLAGSRPRVRGSSERFEGRAFALSRSRPTGASQLAGRTVWVTTTDGTSPAPGRRRLASSAAPTSVRSRSSPRARPTRRSRTMRSTTVGCDRDGRPDSASRARRSRRRALGVWYDGSIWWAYNEDRPKLPAGERRALPSTPAAEGGRADARRRQRLRRASASCSTTRGSTANLDGVLVAQHAFRASPEPVAARRPRTTRDRRAGSSTMPTDRRFALDEAVHYIVGP